jgi:hypothetical protein
MRIKWVLTAITICLAAAVLTMYFRIAKWVVATLTYDAGTIWSDFYFSVGAYIVWLLITSILFLILCGWSARLTQLTIVNVFMTVVGLVMAVLTMIIGVGFFVPPFVIVLSAIFLLTCLYKESV